MIASRTFSENVTSASKNAKGFGKLMYSLDSVISTTRFSQSGQKRNGNFSKACAPSGAVS